MITLDKGGELVIDPNENLIDKNNYPWELTNIEGLIDILKQIDKGEI